MENRMALEIDLRSFRYLFGHDTKDLGCVINAIQDCIGVQGNLLKITCELKNMGIISEENYEILIELHRGNRDMSLPEYILRLLMMIPLEDLCFILDRHGLNTVVIKLQEARYTRLYRKPQKRELRFAKFIHKYYKNLKSQIDNNCIIGGKQGIRIILRDFIATCDDTVASSQSTDNNRQLALEKNAVHFVLLMQQYQNPEERDIILTQALKTETNGCDNTSLQIVCHSKLACTEAFRENNDAAQAYITQAKALCENISPCFALTSAYHDDLFLQTLFFSNEQSDETSESALKGSESALLCMFEEQKEVQVIWKRIILQYMVMSLLKIKLDFKVHRNEITKENVTKAKELLHEIDKNSQGIEKRRQMIKSLCYGVVYEMEGDLDSAKAFLEEALDIARDGGCFHTNELHNIEDYHAHLSAQTSRKYISS
ncbi:uncharacterized protein LOC132753817 [Ruditapes philippinarum]|uniref:uncharacterized protein LOC132753817 n=1 Tax=Ruditapes philippinarum TaxID=129788 RepID=UPI00295C0A73|nr:uncharacterized protein LOC132753817 [Ruditapes philippinarum]